MVARSDPPPRIGLNQTFFVQDVYFCVFQTLFRFACQRTNIESKNYIPVVIKGIEQGNFTDNEKSLLRNLIFDVEQNAFHI